MDPTAYNACQSSSYWWKRHAIIAAAHGPARVERLSVFLLLLVEKTCYYCQCSWTRPRITPVSPPPIGRKDMLLLPLLVDRSAKNACPSSSSSYWWKRHAIIAAARGPCPRITPVSPPPIGGTVMLLLSLIWTRPSRTPVSPPPPIGGKDMLLLPLLVDPPA